MEAGEAVQERERGADYQDPVFLVFGQDNGRYSTNDSLRGTRSKRDSSFVTDRFNITTQNGAI